MIYLFYLFFCTAWWQVGTAHQQVQHCGRSEQKREGGSNMAPGASLSRLAYFPSQHTAPRLYITSFLWFFFSVLFFIIIIWDGKLLEIKCNLTPFLYSNVRTYILCVQYLYKTLQCIRLCIKVKHLHCKFSNIIKLISCIVFCSWKKNTDIFFFLHVYTTIIKLLFIVSNFTHRNIIKN
jgi:hypothetical protein